LEFFIYGSEPPKINFSQSPNGSFSFVIENKNKVRYFKENVRGKSLSWCDIHPMVQEIPGFIKDYDSFEELLNNPKCPEKSIAFKALNYEFNRITSHFAQFTESEAERNFFDYYIKDITEFEDPVWKWHKPVLIPQVWVNWLHYDSKDKNRKDRAQKEPFRVDFVMKDKEVGEEFIIIEIDGESHFGKYLTKDNGGFILQPSMEEYTKHVRKDRWLRNQGWKVFRITALEIEKEADNFYYWFREVLGKPDVPF